MKTHLAKTNRMMTVFACDSNPYKKGRTVNFEEFEARVSERIYTSATPGKYEFEHVGVNVGQVVEQIIRPTGLVDPIIDIRPVVEKGNYPGQVKDFIDEAERRHELYSYDSSRQQQLLTMVEQFNGNLSDKEQTLHALHAINAARAEIDWLQRTGHIYLDKKEKFLD